MKKLYSLIIEFIYQLINRKRLLQPMKMEAWGQNIIGQGYMISNYSNLDQASFYDLIKSQVDYVKSINNRDGLTIVDIGANLGFYSIAYSLIDNTTQVLAFEPFPETYEYLKENIANNDIRNITAINKGLFSQNKDMPIGRPNIFRHYRFYHKLFKFFDTEQSGGSSVFTSQKLAPIVKFEKGDDCQELKALKHIDIIKVDVEGSELFALQGMQRTILHHKPVLCIELAYHALSSAEVSIAEIFEYLIELGYRKYCICGQDYFADVWIPIESIPEIKGAKDYFFSF